MQAYWLGSLLALLMSVPMATRAGTAPAPAAQAQSSSPFVAPVALRGTLGERDIQLNLRLKPEMTDAIEGEYFVFGHGRNVLVAGEVEGYQVFMEESENGTDVSGEWDGKLVGDLFSGEWLSADGSVKKPFSLRIVRDARGNTVNLSGTAGR